MSEMRQSMTRFLCPSANLSLGWLLRRSPRVFGLAFGCALTIHLGVSRIQQTREQPAVAKPLTTKFVKRLPRLTKPLELKKRPQPRRRQVQRRMVAVRASMRPGGSGPRFRGAYVLGGLVVPRVSVGRLAGIRVQRMEPQAVAEVIRPAKDMEQKIDMSLELTDVTALDTGKHHALVIEDPNDKRNLRGFFHLAQALIPSAVAAQGASGGYAWDRGPTPVTQAIPELVAAINRHTDIRATVGPFITIESREIFKTPWVLVTTQVTFKITYSEARTLGRWLLGGGFLYADDSLHTFNSAPDKALRTLFVDALSSQGRLSGRDWDFDKIGHDHPIYHCYFDFEGPPPGMDDFGHARGWIFAPASQPVHYLLAVNIDDRMVGIETSKNYSACWARPTPETRRMVPARQFQFGVNMIVFALTQEGSITQRLMDSVQ